MKCKGCSLEFSLIFFLLFVVASSTTDWVCRKEASHCYILADRLLNWEEAYKFCSEQGGDVYSAQRGNMGTSFLEEWMPLLDPSLNNSVIWTGLRASTNYFNWIIYRPAYVPEWDLAWASGHPRMEVGCVTTNQRLIMHSTSCDEMVATICIRNASISLSKLNRTETEMRVELVPSRGSVSYGALKVPRKVLLNTNFTLHCNVDPQPDDSKQILMYSWLKDDTYLLYYNKKLTPGFIYDRSKLVSNDTEKFYLQGTYICQVQQLGTSRRISSKPIIITGEDVQTAVVTVHTNSPAYSIHRRPNDTIRDLVSFLKGRRWIRSNNSSVEWDHLGYISQPNGYQEFRYVVYISNLLYHAELGDRMDHLFLEVSNFLSKPFPKEGVSTKVTFRWTHRCSSSSETFTAKDGTSASIPWSPTWHGHYANAEVNYLCVRQDNGAEHLERLCIANYTHGAQLNPINDQGCETVKPAIPLLCHSGYTPIPGSDICVKLSSLPASWSDSMSSCVNHWPESDTFGSSLRDIRKAIIEFGRSSNVQLPQEMWLPVRRPLIYGTLRNYFGYLASADDIQSDVHKIEEPNQFDSLDYEECLSVNNSDFSFKIRNCDDALHTACLRKSSTVSDSENLCPDSWFGSVIEDGRLLCFKNFSAKHIRWNEAQEACAGEKFDIPSAVLSLATFPEEWMSQATNFSHLIRENTWIGLHWSEEHKKFCWSNKSNCQFDSHRWQDKADFQNGEYGAMTTNLTWTLLPKSRTLNSYLCQAEVNLSVHEKIQLSLKDADVASVKILQSDVKDAAVRHYSIEEILENGPRINNTRRIQTPPSLMCYKDGERHVVSTYSQDLPLSSGVYHCDGWVGWPRRFEQSMLVTAQIARRYSFVAQIETAADRLTSGRPVDKTFHSNFVDFINEHQISVTEFMMRGFNGRATDFTILRFQHSQESMLRIYVRVDVSVRRPESSTEQAVHAEALEYYSKTPCFNGGHREYCLVQLRSTANCPPERMGYLNLTWPSVSIGQFADPEEVCYIDEYLPLTRKCGGDVSKGARWDPLPENFNQTVGCAPVNANVHLLRQLAVNLTAKRINSSEAIQQISGICTKNSGTLSPAEIREIGRGFHLAVNSIKAIQSQYFSQISSVISAILDTKPAHLEMIQQTPDMSNCFVDILEKVMSKVEIDAESKQIKYQHPSMVFKVIEVPNQTPKETTVYQDVVGFTANTIKNESVFADLKKLLADSPPEEFIGNDVTVRFPVKELREKYGDSSSLRLSFAVAQDSSLFDARRNMTIYSETGEPQPGFQLDSVVVIARVQDRSVTDLQERVQIFFKSTAEQRVESPECVYWEERIPANAGGWSRRGCQYLGLNSSHNVHVCECNHLTPFALLIPYIELPPDQISSLSILTIAGCSLSLFGLSFVIITFLAFEKWRKPLGNKILFNLALALFALFTAYLGGSQLVLKPRLCKVASAATHYFLLASFAWMLVESIYQYLYFVKVIGVKAYVSRFMRKAAPLSWGLPLIPVIGLLVYDSDLYRSTLDICWIQLEPFYYVVLLPLATVVSINIVVFIAILKNVLFRAKIPSNQDQTRLFLSQFRMAVCVFFLLGIGWVFGFLAIGKIQMIFVYLFSIFTTLQGFVIFAFYILREKAARAFWKQLFTVCKTKPDKCGSPKNLSKQSESYSVAYKMTKL